MSRFWLLTVIQLALCTMIGADIVAAADAPPVASADSQTGLLLPPQTAEPGRPDAPKARSSGLANSSTVIGGLAVCLGLFFLFVWATKRNGPQGTGSLPAEVVEPLGRTMLSARHHLQLLRIGRKLILLDVTPTGARTLTEISDSHEVERLLGLCQQGRANSVTASFREVLAEYETAPAGKGFLGDTKQSDWELAARVPRRQPVRREVADA